jgi:hypothetical protein
MMMRVRQALARIVRPLAACVVLLALGGFASVAKATPTWMAPVILSANAQNATSPQVASDGHGNAAAVWLYQSDGTNNVVQVSTHAPGGAWSGPIDISVPGKNAQAPQVAVDHNGDAAAVWVRSDGSNNIVQVATRPAGGSWSTPMDLSQGGQDADSPRVALDASGDVFVAWDRYDGSNDRLQVAVDTGGMWGATQTLSVAGKSANLYDLKVNSAGSAMAAWDLYDASGNYVIQVATYAAGTWDAPQSLSDPTGQGAAPSLALDSAGDATVAWEERAPDLKFVIQSSSRTAGGSWTTPQTVSAEAANNPLVTEDNAGNTTIAWDLLAGQTYSVQAKTDGLAVVTLDSATSPQNVGRIGLAMDAHGNLTATMFRYVDAAHVSIEAVYQATGTGVWSAPVTIAGFASSGFNRSALAVDSADNGTTVWEASGGAHSAVQAAISTNTSITGKPAANTNQTTATFTFSSTETTPTFQCKLDTGPFTACTSPQVYNNLANGQHSFEVEATDGTGLADPAGPVSATWNVNTTPPVVSLNSPTDGEALNSSTPSISGTAGSASNDDQMVSVDIYAGATVSGTPQTVVASVASGAWSVTAPTLPDGTYTVRAHQNDNAGNTGYSSTVTFHIDTIPPTPTLTTPIDGSTVATATPTFAGGAGTSPGDESSLTVFVYAGGTTHGQLTEMFGAPATNGTWSTPATPPLANGIYTAQAHQLDEAGNVGLTTAHTFTVNTGVPQTTITQAPPASTAATAASISFASSQANSTFACTLDNGTAVPCTSPATYTALSPGGHSFSVTATDALGQADPSPPVVSWTITALASTSPPSNTSRPPVTGAPTAGARLSASAGTWSGTTPISFGYQWQRCDPSCENVAGATDSSYTLVTGDLGAHVRVVVTAINAIGNASAESAGVGPIALSAAGVRALFGKHLNPGGKAAKIAAVLKKGGYSLPFTAPTAGKLVISWYQVPKGAHIANVKPRANAKPVLAATGSRRFFQGSTNTITIRLTVAGKKLLKRAKSLKLTARGIFTPIGTIAVVATTTFTLRY